MDSKIDFIKLFPGKGAYDSIRIQPHSLLECNDGLFCSAAENAVLGRGRNAWIIFGNDI